MWRWQTERAREVDFKQVGGPPKAGAVERSFAQPHLR
jgi:hypothetical protein